MREEHSDRRHDLDWLRVIASYVLVLFHVAMVFNPAPFYHVRNGDVSMLMLVLCGFISLWHMPLFFTLAGWSAHASLAARGAAGFVRERILKLLVPLVAGSVLMMPVVKYLELRGGLDLNHAGLRVAPELQASFREVIPSGLDTAEPFTESFGAFLPTFFSLERFTWGHLWFLAYLLTFSLLYLPLLGLLRRGRSRTTSMGTLAVYLPALPLAVIQVTMRERWPGIQNLYDDWANFGYYTTFLLAGFLAARHPAWEAALHREWRRALAVALATTLVLLLAVLGVVSDARVVLAGSAVAGWCFVVAWLGFARARLVRRSPTLGYLADSAFPVYLLHQIVIVTIGYLVVRLPWGIVPKFLLLLGASYAVTLAIYHLGVRTHAVARLLCGLKAGGGGPLAVPTARRTAALLLLATLILGARAAGAATPLGVWWAERGQAQVEIHRCGAALCGRVVAITAFGDDGCPLRDHRNTDRALRDRPVLGLEVLRDLRPTSGDGDRWTGGTIYDPGSGRTYRCTLALDGPDRLELRGYVGVPLLGRTTTWFRVGSEEQRCAAPGV